MEALKEILPIVLQASLLLLVFALGLQATPADAIQLFRRPRQLLRAVVAIDVVVPVVAVLLVILLPIAPIAKLGIVLMAISPLPPLVPGKQLKLGGNTGYICGLYVAVSLLAVVLVPLTLMILSTIFPRDAWIPPAAIARTVLISVLLPLAAGMVARHFAPRFADRAAPVVSKLASLFLVLLILPILIAVWPAMRDLLGNGTALAIVAIVGAAILAGHLLGGPDPDDRTALAVASATRHPGIALLIGKTSFPAAPVAPAVLLFLIVGLLAALPYQVWSKKRLAERLRVSAG
jgi:BASS family bile acid:Na+ symporter